MDNHDLVFRTSTVLWHVLLYQHSRDGRSRNGGYWFFRLMFLFLFLFLFPIFILFGRWPSATLQDSGHATRRPPTFVGRNQLPQDGHQHLHQRAGRRAPIFGPLRPTEGQATSMASTRHRIQAHGRFVLVRGIILLHRRMFNFRLPNVARRSNILLQVSFRSVNQFSRYSLRSFALSSNVVERAFILPRLCAF